MRSFIYNEIYCQEKSSLVLVTIIRIIVKKYTFATLYFLYFKKYFLHSSIPNTWHSIILSQVKDCRCNKLTEEQFFYIFLSAFVFKWWHANEKLTGSKLLAHTSIAQSHHIALCKPSTLFTTFFFSVINCVQFIVPYQLKWQVISESCYTNYKTFLLANKVSIKCKPGPSVRCHHLIFALTTKVNFRYAL